MHQVEKIQSYFRVKPEKPKIEEIYVPFPDYDEYILIFNDESTQSHKYDFMMDVVELLTNYNKQIKFIQISNTKDPEAIPEAFLVKDISYNQLSFLVKHSKLVICTDVFTPEVCGIYDKPMVCLSGNRHAVHANPYFYNPHKHVSICPVDQPSFSSFEPDKAINKIMPEDIVDEILKLLNIKAKKESIKTEFVGNLYRKYTIDYIPDFIIPANSVKLSVNARLDIENNIENLIKSVYSKNYIECIFCNSEFDVKKLIPIKNNVKSVKVELNVDSSVEFVKELNKLGCNVILHTKDKENLKNIRLKFIDWKVSLTEPKTKQIKIKKDKNYFYKSTKLVLSGNKKYISLSCKIKDIKTNALIDCPEFWEESDHFMIYSVDK